MAKATEFTNTERGIVSYMDEVIRLMNTVYASMQEFNDSTREVVKATNEVAKAIVGLTEALEDYKNLWLEEPEPTLPEEEPVEGVELEDADEVVGDGTLESSELEVEEESVLPAEDLEVDEDTTLQPSEDIVEDTTDGAVGGAVVTPEEDEILLGDIDSPVEFTEGDGVVVYDEETMQEDLEKENVITGTEEDDSTEQEPV